MKKAIRKAVTEASKIYSEQLLNEINQDRDDHGKKPFDGWICKRVIDDGIIPVLPYKPPSRQLFYDLYHLLRCQTLKYIQYTHYRFAKTLRFDALQQNKEHNDVSRQVIDENLLVSRFLEVPISYYCRSYHPHRNNEII